MFGATFAYKATKAGKRCLVIDRRDRAGGNVYCESKENINVHIYGAHIFHTSNRMVWEFVNSITPFNRYCHSVLAKRKNKIYNLPFNMNTFYQFWGVTTPKEARGIVQKLRAASGITAPANLEEQAVYSVGPEIYEALIKDYTEKQWGRSARELPAEIARRLPVRFSYDNNYFDDAYQGIPIGGYNNLIGKLLGGIEVRLSCNYFQRRDSLCGIAKNIIFTGRIDEYFEFKYGMLDYRSLRFETETMEDDNFQGCSVVNYCDPETPFTRIIEHKHFEFGRQEKTVITREFPLKWEKDLEPYYPVNDEKNNRIFAQYESLGRAEPRTFFGGRLAEYKYYDMDRVVENAITLARKIAS